ncbi:hypothetical protein UPYG_G00252310 [Umbra pygmaea]|uniref:Adhesion G-protein coupled receptor G6 n=1 Tax=Umbra pygmaea TaxID=75934 RepID=A0ABD0WC80_UMBPY
MYKDNVLNRKNALLSSSILRDVEQETSFLSNKIMESHVCGGWWRWKFRNVLCGALFWMSLQEIVLSCSNSNCIVVLTDPQGALTSPCFPQEYPNGQTCKWTLLAPTGFIVQINFLDFELEEAPKCSYDRVVVNTGNQNVTFCGLTANGLILNSTGNVMEVLFTSDFSIQKRGFSISYRQVAVSLRNQKVTVTNGASKVVQVSSLVSIPSLSEFTVCFEIARASLKNKETIFSYTLPDDVNGIVALSFGKNQDGTALVISTQTCLVDSIFNATDFTSTMKPFCLTWASTSGKVTIYYNNIYKTKICTNMIAHSPVGSRGLFRLGDQNSFDGTIYNFRLWDYAMTVQQLESLPCDTIGNVIDWDNSFWDIPSSLAQTDSTLSCSTSVPIYTSTTTSCASPGPGCPGSLTATRSSTVTTNMISTNSTTDVLSATTSSSSNTSMPVTITTVTTSLPLFTTTNALHEITTTPEGLFYRISFLVNDKEGQLSESDVEKTVSQWLNQTFQNWTQTQTVYVDDTIVQPYSGTQLKRSLSKKYICQALLVYRTTSTVTLGETAISAWLMGSASSIKNGLELDTVTVETVENCPAESPLHYSWPESRPTVTQYIPCFPNKDQNASRTCLISNLTYRAVWGSPVFSNCTDIDNIEVSAENAAEVAVQLADITNNELSSDEVSKVVGKVKELVTVAKINSSLATTVVSIISNVMASSESALAIASERTLKTVDDLVQKIEFDGPSVRIISKHLALGISAVNHSEFNGTSFSAFTHPNHTDLQVDFKADQLNPLGQVTLPATLLNNLTEAEAAALSRINFMFFSKTGLFQDKLNGLSLNSYVVASSVGNYSINNLHDPVQIEIAHVNYQTNPKPTCMFWDFTLKNGTGGWSRKGCMVSPLSNGNKTICLCNHLTHFGILMDISGSAEKIDQKNNQILTFITYIGCGISAIFSAATLLTYIAFEKLRRDYPSKILMNLSTSLLFLNMVFLLDGWLASFDMEGLCVAVAIFLHFFLLTSFTWMGLESIHMYIALVKVFNTYIRRYILKFCIVGWGLPATIVAIVIAQDKNSYGKLVYGHQGATEQGSSEFCWIRSTAVFYVTCVGYFSIIFLMNVAMFIVVMIQICGRNGKRSNRTLHDEVLRNLRSVVSLTFLLGMTWGFAFFAWGPVNLAFMYLFTIFNSLQGLFIFIFHCALKENVQKQWRRYLCCGKFRLADNSDWSKTATNNTKKVSSDTVGKSLSSSSFGSSTANWTSKAKATLNPFAKRNSNAGKRYSNQTSPKSVSSEVEASSSSSIIPVHQVIDKVRGFCSVRSDNFYKNIIMSDSFNHSTKF